MSRRLSVTSRRPKATRVSQASAWSLPSASSAKQMAKFIGKHLACAHIIRVRTWSPRITNYCTKLEDKILPDLSDRNYHCIGAVLTRPSTKRLMFYCAAARNYATVRRRFSRQGWCCAGYVLEKTSVKPVTLHNFKARTLQNWAYSTRLGTGWKLKTACRSVGRTRRTQMVRLYTSINSWQGQQSIIPTTIHCRPGACAVVLNGQKVSKI